LLGNLVGKEAGGSLTEVRGAVTPAPRNVVRVVFGLGSNLVGVLQGNGRGYPHPSVQVQVSVENGYGIRT